MPRLGKGGTPETRVAILHSLAHIESWAIDLSWDIIARFGAPRAMPRAFFDDFVAVAVDEARHFKGLAARLQELGSRRGPGGFGGGAWSCAHYSTRAKFASKETRKCISYSKSASRVIK